ncbi:MAG: succinyl-diaminopimelate desuccinylase [Helicobacteraceae bacterium]|jgi:succinyl-diaminopimelate desuccinylase|nr:succinyl-diaminopimelate desuccinylase [Helicobacteraceae bacterium]
MDLAVELLKELIACQSVTPNEAGAFAAVTKVLGDFSAERIDINGVSNLSLTRDGGANKPHLCFAGHIDVVLSGDGWLSDPFKPIEREGRIVGRGAQDMKAGVAAFAAACALTPYDGKLSILLTSDEEGDAIWGTKAVLEILKDRGELPYFAIVAEPTCERVFGDTIKIGRRGSINGTLNILGKSGHVAYPEKIDNPIDKLGRLLPIISGATLDCGDDHFAPSRLIISDIRGGYEKSNLTPSNVRLTFNVRNSTLIDETAVKNFIENALKTAAISEYELSIKTSSNAFINYDERWIKALSESIKKHTGASPKLSTGGGTSDARFFAAHKIAVAEFGAINDLIHAANESVSIEEVRGLTLIFSDLIKRIGDIEI